MFQVSTREGVHNTVPKVAQLVKKYGEPFLAGRPDSYDELQRVNERASVTFERGQMLTRIRKKAETAWKAKEFARVTELLQPIRSDLTGIEIKRLAYAEKQVGSAVHESTEEASKRR
jgi:hypothetical protein